MPPTSSSSEKKILLWVSLALMASGLIGAITLLFFVCTDAQLESGIRIFIALFTLGCALLISFFLDKKNQKIAMKSIFSWVIGGSFLGLIIGFTPSSGSFMFCEEEKITVVLVPVDDTFSKELYFNGSEIEIAISSYSKKSSSDKEIVRFKLEKSISRKKINSYNELPTKDTTYITKNRRDIIFTSPPKVRFDDEDETTYNHTLKILHEKIHFENNRLIIPYYIFECEFSIKSQDNHKVDGSLEIYSEKDESLSLKTVSKDSLADYTFYYSIKGLKASFSRKCSRTNIPSDLFPLPLRNKRQDLMITVPSCGEAIHDCSSWDELYKKAERTIKPKIEANLREANNEQEKDYAQNSLDLLSKYYLPEIKSQKINCKKNGFIEKAYIDLEKKISTLTKPLGKK